MLRPQKVQGGGLSLILEKGPLEGRADGLGKELAARGAVVDHGGEEADRLCAAHVKDQIGGAGIGGQQPALLVQLHPPGQHHPVRSGGVQAVVQQVDVQRYPFQPVVMVGQPYGPDAPVVILGRLSQHDLLAVHHSHGPGVGRPVIVLLLDIGPGGGEHGVGDVHTLPNLAHRRAVLRRLDGAAGRGGRGGLAGIGLAGHQAAQQANQDQDADQRKDAGPPGGGEEVLQPPAHRRGAGAQLGGKISPGGFHFRPSFSSSR